MKANELRIGNYIQVKYKEWTIERVDAITIEILGESGNDEYQPVPLTPEILEKCGAYNESGNENIYSYVIEVGGEDDIHIIYRGGVDIEDRYYIYCRGADLRPPFQIKYVHQLQNLYFALSGSELDAKV